MNNPAVQQFMKWDDDWPPHIGGMWVAKDNCYHPETAMWVSILDQRIDDINVVESIVRSYNRHLIQDYRTNLTLHYLKVSCDRLSLSTAFASLCPRTIVSALRECGIQDLCQISEAWQSINQDFTLGVDAKDQIKQGLLAPMTTLTTMQQTAVTRCLINFYDCMIAYHPPWVSTPYSPWYVEEFTTPIMYAPVNRPDPTAHNPVEHQLHLAHPEIGMFVA